MENPNQDTETAKDTNAQDKLMGKLFFGKYKINKKLGEGSFGMIYRADSQGEDFALKLESKTKGDGLLEAEAMILTYLKGPRIPYAKAYGYSGDYNVLVMELLGLSLEDLMEMRKKFSVKTVAMLGYQMVSILEDIHNKHIIHRDMKPDNFVIGLNENSQYLYLIDFGLAKKYRSSKTLVQYPLINKKKLTGTARYASINALRGYEQSRRDDLEGAAYVLMYLVKGSLPWQGLQVKNKEDRYKKILEKKEETTSKELCLGFPKQFEQLIDYAKSLEYTEDPDYEMLRELFASIVSNLKWKFDYIYDWSTKEEIAIRLAETRTLKTENDSKINHIGTNRNGNGNNVLGTSPTRGGGIVNITETHPHNHKLNKHLSLGTQNSKQSYQRKKSGRPSSREEVVVYKTTQTENVKTQRETDKVESKCCIVF